MFYGIQEAAGLRLAWLGVGLGHRGAEVKAGSHLKIKISQHCLSLSGMASSTPTSLLFTKSALLMVKTVTTKRFYKVSETCTVWVQQQEKADCHQNYVPTNWTLSFATLKFRLGALVRWHHQYNWQSKHTVLPRTHMLQPIHRVFVWHVGQGTQHPKRVPDELCSLGQQPFIEHLALGIKKINKTWSVS